MILEFFAENKDVFIRILEDISDVSKYASAGIVIALIYGAVYLLYTLICKLMKRERKLGMDHAVAVFMLLIYMTAFVYIVLMSREADTYSGVNMELWSSWGHSVTTKAFFIENILLFIPMGILMPSAFKAFRKPFVCIPVCMLVSLCIETIQYSFGLGIAELDDVITNTAGGAIGYIIWLILLFIHWICIRVNIDSEK
ncbi:VanZ family protein [Butyrivibrio sp. MB2005]|uniref:VanZ family protein n=1 Tax=Butyrivibrio sp. MB2005 TaxID=1280678 RepID=UPI00041C43EE|nr:VanZ family protein [Butyrivibrio sp. MB2005]